MDNMEIQDADVSFVNSIVSVLQSLRKTAGLKGALLGPRQF